MSRYPDVCAIFSTKYPTSMDKRMGSLLYVYDRNKPDVVRDFFECRWVYGPLGAESIRIEKPMIGFSEDFEVEDFKNGHLIKLVRRDP